MGDGKTKTSNYTASNQVKFDISYPRIFLRRNSTIQCHNYQGHDSFERFEDRIFSNLFSPAVALPKIFKEKTEGKDTPPKIKNPSFDKNIPLANYVMGDRTVEIAACGPRAFASILLWLDNNGFPDVVEGDHIGRVRQSALIEEIGKLMKLDKKGVDDKKLADGIRKYFKKQNYDCRIEYRGNNIDVIEDGDPNDLPTLEFIDEGCRGSSNIIIRLAYYQYNTKTKKYTPDFGHYVAVSGIGGISDNSIDIIVTDPSSKLTKLKISKTKDRNDIDAVIAPRTIGRKVSRFFANRMAPRVFKNPEQWLAFEETNLPDDKKYNGKLFVEGVIKFTPLKRD